MLTNNRWRIELQVMQENYRKVFSPYRNGDQIGFTGQVLFKGVLYQINAQGSVSQYPQAEPGVYMNPHPETHHWINDNRLCYIRDSAWNPAASTFASCVAVAIKYIRRFG